jgi:hypothetical protein
MNEYLITLKVRKLNTDAACRLRNGCCELLNVIFRVYNSGIRPTPPNILQHMREKGR